MNHKGLLVVISGFSGVGKGTLVKRLMAEYENYALSISMTTRNPRNGKNISLLLSKELRISSEVLKRLLKNTMHLKLQGTTKRFSANTIMRAHAPWFIAIKRNAFSLKKF